MKSTDVLFGIAATLRHKSFTSAHLIVVNNHVDCGVISRRCISDNGALIAAVASCFSSPIILDVILTNLTIYVDGVFAPSTRALMENRRSSHIVCMKGSRGAEKSTSNVAAIRIPMERNQSNLGRNPSRDEFAKIITRTSNTNFASCNYYAVGGVGVNR